jgi:hypothetical protein
MTNDEPMGLCLAEEEEGNDQVIEASEMERLRTILTMRYKNED